VSFTYRDEALNSLNVLHHDSLVIPSDLHRLQRVLDWFERQRLPSIDEQTWLQCQLALSEGFTNAVTHAHQNLPPETLVTIEVAIFTHYLEIHVWDQGPPFDLKAQLRKIKTSLDLDRPRGRGLMLLQKIAQRLQYCRTTDGRNCLSIIKPYALPEENISA
jgi:serine/threonine-protein kinase RsbW